MHDAGEDWPSEAHDAVVTLGQAICGDFAQAERREWWLANGTGGYAAGTVAGTLSRTYHGLLIAPLQPPLGRVLVLAKADATFCDTDGEWPLFSNRWAGGVTAPAGHVHIARFALHGTIPVWRYAFGDRVVEHAIWLEPGANTVYAAWRLLGENPARLRVDLLANHRDHNGGDGGFAPSVTVANDELLVAADGTMLRIKVPGGTVVPHADWYENFFLSVEAERGLSATTRHLHVATAEIPLVPGQWAGIVASVEKKSDPDIAAALRWRIAYDREVLARAKLPAGTPPWIAALVLAADAFLFARPLPGLPDGVSVIAGYPWFGDWGRDSMIALPGLTLATGRADLATRLLETFSHFVDEGMLPNLFPGAGETPEYNTVDATLWFFEVIRLTVDATGDTALLGRLFPVLENIVAWHEHGTRYGIRVDPADGLLAAGVPGVQLTWMDARVDGHEVTPRIGKPVEVNALWYNALCAMAGFSARLGKDAASYSARAERVRASFGRFVRPGGLFDVLDGPDGDDARVRPNQIFAVSLTDSPLDHAQQHEVLAACGTLLCPTGLRSLAPDDPQYRHAMTGSPADRDHAYHQGTVWGWLLGHYARAHFRVHGDAAAALAWLAPIADHLSDAGLGTISEVFDGDAPHTPRGCPSQAWSVGSVLEAWWRITRDVR